VRTWSSTNRRIAEDRLPCWRPLSISAITFDRVACCVCAISLRSLQKASSRLTLVLCPSMMMERLTIDDFLSTSSKKFSQVSSGDSAWRGRQRSTFSKKTSPLRYRNTAHVPARATRPEYYVPHVGTSDQTTRFCRRAKYPVGKKLRNRTRTLPANYRKAAKAAFKQALNNRFGSLGAASAVRRIDPKTGEVIEVVRSADDIRRYLGPALAARL
jgi:hypothetical protein